MYYIVGGECSGRWVAYGVATSTDGVHWQDQGDMLYPLTEIGSQQSCANSAYELGSVLIFACLSNFIVTFWLLARIHHWNQHVSSTFG